MIVLIADITVTPLAGVWIEILQSVAKLSSVLKSLPLRECGLKCFTPILSANSCCVTPLRECGLKSLYGGCVCPSRIVTPLAGVWIEIHITIPFPASGGVTPLAGVWIEIWSG